MSLETLEHDHNISRIRDYIGPLQNSPKLLTILIKKKNLQLTLDLRLRKEEFMWKEKWLEDGDSN